MKKSFLFLNIFFIVLMLFCGLCYLTCPVLFVRLFAKVLAGLCFFIIGILNFSVSRKGILILIGLLCCLFGDITLTYVNFLLGAVIFAFGHLFYFGAFCSISSFKKKDILPILLLFILSGAVILFVPIFSFGASIMKLMCLIYAFFLSLMCGKSISNFLQNKTTCTRLLLIGSILFFFSDMMLLFFCFAGAPRIVDFLCFLTYYPAQIFLGIAGKQSYDEFL